MRILKNKNIFLVSPEPWDGIFVSKHHYAIEFAKNGNRVFFINPPSTKLREKLVISSVKEHTGLFLVDYKIPLRGMRFFPTFFINMMERRFLKTVERKANIQFDIIFNFENSRFYNMNFARAHQLKVYFQVDTDQNYHPLIAAKTCDIAFAINDEILGIIKPFAKHSFKIPHSFQGTLSQQSKDILRNAYIYRKPLGRLKAMYVGYIDNHYIDINLVEKIVNQNTGIDFIFIGPFDKQKPMYRKLSKYENVEFKGQKHFSEIPSFLSQSDLLILIYSNNFTFSSHKILEYLSSGKVIISTFMREYIDFPDLFVMSTSNDDFPILFNETVKNIEIFNSRDKMIKRILFAMNNSYSENIKKIEKLITTIS